MTRISLSLSLAALAVTPATVLMAQSARLIRVGDSSLHTAAIRPWTDTLILVMRQGDSLRRVMTVHRSLTPVTTSGRAAWAFVQEYVNAAGAGIDSSLVLAASLAPVRYAATVRGELQELTFRHDRIMGSVTPKDSVPRPVLVRLDAPVFNAVADDALFAALPLAPNYRVRYAVYNPPRALGTVEVRVIGDTTLTTGNGPRPAWVLAYDAGAAPTTLWLTKGTQRLIRSRTMLPNGAEFWRIAFADIGLALGKALGPGSE